MLRGTYKKKNVLSYKAPSLQNQINALRRQVLDQKRDPEYFQIHGEVVHSTANWKVTQVNLTNEMITATGFRDAINGDSWRNNYLDMRFLTKTRVEFCRVIIYAPLRSGATFTPSVDDAGSVVVPDPTAFKVLHDDIFIMHAALVTEEGRRRWINLRKLVTLYNGHNTTIERNDIKMTIITKASSTGSSVMWNAVFCVTEK